MILAALLACGAPEPSSVPPACRGCAAPALCVLGDGPARCEPSAGCGWTRADGCDDSDETYAFDDPAALLECLTDAFCPAPTEGAGTGAGASPAARATCVEADGAVLHVLRCP